MPFYNRIEPSLFGIPFFYWCQMLWIVLGALLHPAGLSVPGKPPQMSANPVTLTVFLVLFVLVALLGFVALALARGRSVAAA